MFLNLKEGAILIADAHYPNHKKEEFLAFLNAVYKKEIKTQQLIFMGDIFDLLVGNSPYLKERFKSEIALINLIAQDIEVIYLEGNHDFYLKPLFENIKIYPITTQPLKAKFNSKIICLSHGDKIFMPFIYKVYTTIIRNPITLKIIPDIVAKYKLKSMSKKSICKKIINFEDRVKKIKDIYSCDFIIEGHYHQDRVYKNYYALPSFACSNKIAVVVNGNIEYKEF